MKGFITKLREKGDLFLDIRISILEEAESYHASKTIFFLTVSFIVTTHAVLIMAEKKVPKTLLRRIDRWNKDKAKLIKDYYDIEREARKRGLVAPKRKAKKR